MKSRQGEGRWKFPGSRRDWSLNVSSQAKGQTVTHLMSLLPVVPAGVHCGHFLLITSTLCKLI